MTFLLQSLLTLGLPLIALPLLIHLINLRKHRRVEWAAMQFLLESEKKNKKSILLRQLLLLLLRTAAVALVVLMLAGPVLRSEWGRLFGSGTTHHLILLDDSYSMADRWASSSALDEAKRAILSLLDQATQHAGNQKLTLLRFSQAKEVSAGAGLDFDSRTLDRDLLKEAEAMLGKLAVSETDAGPIEALEAAAKLPEPTDDETRIVYVVSDFRTRQWSEETQLGQMLEEIRRTAGQLHLISCVDRTQSNLAITQLEPESGVRAAGVETWMLLTVANYGDQPAVAVIVNVQQDGHRLPAVEFDEILPGQQATRRLRVTFASAGPHRLQASLESDAVATDNVRYFACQVPTTFPVLLIDGSGDGEDSRYLQTALDPGGKGVAGWAPQVERPSFLRRHDQLQRFAAICLLDVPRLDDAEVEALENYVRGGGGLALFVGPKMQRTFYEQQLYRDGTGLMPVPLDVPTQLLSSIPPTADVAVSSHPVFRVFSGQRNSFLETIKIRFYYAVRPDWRVPVDGNTTILATLRNGAPFVIGKQFGAGRTVLQLTRLSPKPTELGSWSNWSLNPVFPVYANELVGHLSSSRRQFAVREVGDPLGLELSEEEYLPEVRIQSPRSGEDASMTVYPKAEQGRYLLSAEGSSGVWLFDLQRRDGKAERRLIAFNVPTGEGDLHWLDRAGLDQQFPEIDYEFSLASQFTTQGNQLAGFKLSETLMYILLLVLIGEQWLAYRASYHTKA